MSTLESSLSWWKRSWPADQDIWVAWKSHGGNVAGRNTFIFHLLLTVNLGWCCCYFVLWSFRNWPMLYLVLEVSDWAFLEVQRVVLTVTVVFLTGCDNITKLHIVQDISGCADVSCFHCCKRWSVSAYWKNSSAESLETLHSIRGKCKPCLLSLDYSLNFIRISCCCLKLMLPINM